MFEQLIATANPVTPAGYSIHNATAKSRISTGVTATDYAPQYMSHVDVPPGRLSGMSTDWHIHLKVLFESGIYSGNPDVPPTGTTSLTRRFVIGVAPISAADPTDYNNMYAVQDAATGSTSIGGQASMEIACIGGSFGHQIQYSRSWSIESDYKESALVLGRWVDDYAASGIRIVVFFKWQNTVPAGHVMKVTSVRADVAPGPRAALVTASSPRTLSLSQFGVHWCKKTTGFSAEVNYGMVRYHDYDPVATASYGTWPAIESTDWSTKTVAQQMADPGWANLDLFVAAHAGKKMIIEMSSTPSFYAADRRSPPSDLASGTASSWYRFCSRVGERLAGKGVIYEIWNEANLASNLYNGWTGTAAQLATMVTLAAQALRAADPSCKIAGPSLVNVVLRGLLDTPAYAKELYAANAGAALLAVDYVSFHAYPLVTPSPLAAAFYTKNMRKILTDLGAPAKPLLMSEMTALALASMTLDARRVFIQRSVLGILLADSNVVGAVWYGLDIVALDWTVADRAAWNSMVTFCTSGPITSAVIDQDGVFLITVGAETRAF